MLNFVLITLSIGGQLTSAVTGADVTHILDNVLRGYDKRVRPNHGVLPVDVVVSMYALRIYDFDSLNNVSVYCVVCIKLHFSYRTLTILMIELCTEHASFVS